MIVSWFFHSFTFVFFTFTAIKKFFKKQNKKTSHLIFEGTLLLAIAEELAWPCKLLAVRPTPPANPAQQLIQLNGSVVVWQHKFNIDNIKPPSTHPVFQSSPLVIDAQAGMARNLKTEAIIIIIHTSVSKFSFVLSKLMSMTSLRDEKIASTKKD